MPPFRQNGPRSSQSMDLPAAVSDSSSDAVSKTSEFLGVVRNRWVALRLAPSAGPWVGSRLGCRGVRRRVGFVELGLEPGTGRLALDDEVVGCILEPIRQGRPPMPSATSQVHRPRPDLLPRCGKIGRIRHATSERTHARVAPDGNENQPVNGQAWPRAAASAPVSVAAIPEGQLSFAFARSARRS